MQHTRKQYIDGDYGQVHLRAAGDLTTPGKRPLLCLHQSPKSSLEFDRFVLAAASERAVIAPDYPGYGMSDRPPSQDEATIETYARNMWHVADALELQQIDLFGNHTGGKVAIEMARQRPNAVHAIAMVSAAILTDAERAQFRDMFEPIPLDEAGTRLNTTWQRIVAHAGPGMTLEMMHRSFVQSMMPGEAYEWGHKAAFDYGAPFERGLRELPQPITILNPVDDLREVTWRAGALMRKGEIVDCPDWGHGFLDVFADAAAKLVLGKLDAA